MIKILFLMRSLEPGCVQRQLAELVRKMDKSKFSIHIVTFYKGGQFWDALSETPDVKISSLEKTNRWDIFGFFSKLLKVIREEQPAVINSYLDVPNIFSTLAGKITNTPSVLGIAASFVDFSQYDWTASMVYYLGALASHFADRVVANSRAGQRYNVEHGYARINMTVIHNGIDTAHFYPDKKRGTDIRLRWGLEPDKPLIGIVGRIDPMKDHVNFLQAAKIVARNYPDCRFACVGRGSAEYTSQMKALGISLLGEDKVLWIDNCPGEDIPAAYNAFDFLVSSSYGEGLAYVIGEGMACGIPCIVTDVGDSAYAVGDTGMVVSPKNAPELAGAMLKMLGMSENERQILGQKARLRVETHFSIQAMVAAYQATFEEVAKPGK